MNALITSNPYSPAQRALNIPEIVIFILNYVPKKTLVSAARVTKLWFGIAIPMLWVELPSATPLFRILAPVEREGGLVFAGVFRPEKMVRLLLYGQHVRYLHHCDRDRDAATGHIYSNFTTDTIIRFISFVASSSRPILPELQEIQLSAVEDIDTLHLVLPLLHEGVKTLKISVRQCANQFECNSVARFFDGVSGVQGLSLDNVKFQFVDAPIAIISGFEQFLQRTQLLALDLPIDAGPSESGIAQDLIHAALPTSLQVLGTSVIFGSEAEYLSRVATIISRVPVLRSLRLEFEGNEWSPSRFEDILPLSTLPLLEELELRNDQAFRLNSHEIFLLGQAIPRLRKLSLRGAPEDRPHLGIKAADLLACASSFPRLQTLAITIEPTSGRIELPWWLAEEAPTAFNTADFVELDIGSSFIQAKDISILAELISRLCFNPRFKIRCDDDPVATRAGLPAAWRTVETRVRQIHGAQRDHTVSYHEWCTVLLGDI